MLGEKAALVFERDSLLFPQPPLRLKESAEDLPARIRHHPGDDLATMIQTRIVQQLIERADRASLRIGRAIDNRRDAGLDNRAGTHRTRFKRHVKRTAVQSPRLPRLGGLGNGDHFGVGRRIMELLALVVRLGNHPALMHDDRADGNFVFSQGLFSLVESPLHEAFVHGAWLCRLETGRFFRANTCFAEVPKEDSRPPLTLLNFLDGIFG